MCQVSRISDADNSSTKQGRNKSIYDSYSSHFWTYPCLTLILSKPLLVLLTPFDISRDLLPFFSNSLCMAVHQISCRKIHAVLSLLTMLTLVILSSVLNSVSVSFFLWCHSTKVHIILSCWSHGNHHERRRVK